MSLETLLLALVALAVSFLLNIFFWPKERYSYPDYIEVLDFNNWKHYDVVHQEVLGRSRRTISENEHDHTLRELEAAGIIEARPLLPLEIEEIVAPNEMGRTHIDRICPYGTITVYEYRLISEHNDSGGPRIRTHKKAPLRWTPTPAYG